MDAKEYQELKQRCRKARAEKRISRSSLVIAGLIVFLLGVTGGLLVSAKRVTKAMPATDTAALRRFATQSAPQSATPIGKEPGQPNGVKDSPQLEVKSKPSPERTSSDSQPTAVKGTKKSGPRPVSLRVSPYFPRIRNAGRTEDAMAYASRVQSLIELGKVEAVTVTLQRPAASCTVVCIVKRDGSIRHAEVVKSSGDKILDSAALRSVRNAGRFPAVPESISGDEISFDLPVAFRKNP